MHSLKQAARTSSCVLLLWGVFGQAAHAQTEAARAVIEETSQAVLTVLQEPGAERASRRKRIQEIAYQSFDFSTMSKLVLAPGWKDFSEAQRGEFVTEFKQLLAANYGERIDQYDREKVQFVGERVEPRGDVTVKTRIVGGGPDVFEVDYRLRDRGDRWLVIDVVIEGVSLVHNYRSQFQEVLRKQGQAGLLAELRAVNASSESG